MRGFRDSSHRSVDPSFIPSRVYFECDLFITDIRSYTAEVQKCDAAVVTTSTSISWKFKCFSQLVHMPTSGRSDIAIDERPLLLFIVIQCFDSSAIAFFLPNSAYDTAPVDVAGCHHHFTHVVPARSKPLWSTDHCPLVTPLSTEETRRPNSEVRGVKYDVNLS